MRPDVMSKCWFLTLAVAAVVGCGGGSPSLNTGPVPPPPPPPPPAPALTRVELLPLAAQLAPGATQQFVATSHWSDSSSTAGDVYYFATGGSVSASGMYSAGPVAGNYRVIAADKATGKADTSDVTIGGGSGGPTYTAEYADDFKVYQDDAALRTAYSANGRRIWNFGGIDWSKVNLIPDPVFGKALRTTQQQQVPFYDLVNAPDGLPGAVQRTEIKFTKGALSGVWVRFYVRFDAPPTNPLGWRTKSPNDPSPFGGAYKVFFLHWSAPYSERGALVFSNTSRLDAQFYVTGLDKVTEGSLPGSGSSQGLTNSDGTEWRDGQWYEMVYHYRRLGGNLARAGAWVRRYTTNGQVAPGPYRWWLSQAEFVGTPPTAAAIELGGNKNHGNEYDQYVIWGPWEVVDADRFDNPFAVPIR